MPVVSSFKGGAAEEKVRRLRAWSPSSSGPGSQDTLVSALPLLCGIGQPPFLFWVLVVLSISKFGVRERWKGDL